MRVGLAQVGCSFGDVERNCMKYDFFASRAKEMGCSAVVFPEMSDIGYIPSLSANIVQSWPGKSYNAASDAAAKYSISLLCGLSEKDGNIFYNSIAYFDPTGQLKGRYRKIHLFSAHPIYEDRYFSSGNDPAIIQFGGIKWGLSICYDLRFPELYRLFAIQGVDVFINCSAWPTQRFLHWDLLSRARAIENQAYFIGVNRVGTDNDQSFCGRSRIVEPTGNIVVEGKEESEELVVGDIDYESIAEYRRYIPSMKSRRPDVYGNFEKRSACT